MSLCFCCFYFDDAVFNRFRGVLHTPQFISGQTSLAAAAALTFFCSFSCVKTRKGEEQGLCPFTPCQDKRRRRTGALPLYPVSRQEKEKNRGFAPLPPPSFLPLMEEKKAKEDQGARGTGQVGRVRDGGGKRNEKQGRLSVGGFIPISCSRRSAAACRLRVTGGNRWG